MKRNNSEKNPAARPLYCLVRDQKFDVAIKRLLGSAKEMLRQLGITEVTERLSPEFPRTRNLRCDLLVRTAGGQLTQLELQAQNLATMPLRMLDYAVASLYCYGVSPRQIVLYVGKGPMRIKAELHEGKIDFEFELLDIRTVDREALLRSTNSADNLIAILAGEREDGVIQEILNKLAHLENEERAESIRTLLILSGLRGWEGRIEEEVQRMPIDIDIMENTVIGPAIRRGIEQGRKEGMEKGREKGIEEGFKELLRAQIEGRFGPLPAAANRKLQKLSKAQALELGKAILVAKSLKELLR